MKLSLIIEARERGSRVVAGMRRGITQLAKDARTAGVALTGVDRSLTRAERSASRLERAAYRTGFAFGTMTRRAITGLGGMARRLQLNAGLLEKMSYFAGRKIGSGLRFGITAGATAAAAGGVGALWKIVSSGLAFEKYRTQLTGFEGSRAAGDKAMSWVTDFARSTPYEIDQVMGAFIALKAYGIDPTNGSLRTLGDTASGMGKDLMAAVEMIADAQTGEFEQLKEFGIRASQQGEKVTFRFMRDGKEMVRTVKKNGAKITRALFEIFNQRFAGGMDRLAQTTAGKWSNLMDRLTFMAKQVWEGGLGASVNRLLDKAGSTIEKMNADGSLSKWAETTGERLGGILDRITNADWQQGAANIQAVAGAVSNVAGAITSLVGLIPKIESFLERMRDLRDSWGGVEWDTRWGGLRWVSPEEMKRRRDGKPATPPAAPPRVIPNTTGVPLMGGASFRRGPSPDGTVRLLVATERGTTVTPTQIEARGMKLEVNTGRAMSGIA